MEQNMEELANYKSRAVRACVLLHEQHLRECLKVWQQAKAAKVQLPSTSDTDYQSLETLLSHVFRAARGYMVWICKQLSLPDPQIQAVPELDRIEAEAEAYLEHLLQRWRVPLKDVADNQLEPQTYLSNWGTPYCIDAMLEHAVMHPIRHGFQLEAWLAK
jgi:uncharacterized damage-inducible protein DinB